MTTSITDCVSNNDGTYLLTFSADVSVDGGVGVSDPNLQMWNAPQDVAETPTITAQPASNQLLLLSNQGFQAYSNIALTGQPVFILSANTFSQSFPFSIQ